MTPQEQAHERYGSTHQLSKLAEECAEAAAAIIRWKIDQTPANRTAMIDELADVEICTAYPRLEFGDAVIQAAVDRKLARLMGMMEVRQ